MIELLKKLQSSLKVAALIITRDMLLVLLFCNRVILLAEGRLPKEEPVVRA